ncbi:MerR family transcriptional regulator [Oceanirhabdus sp. W0125-5]|uniref:MerR family transcriptional regulator n=1 Tax=Oceanirhabdus sp. W0125-5 TaxID=2999116 RepID=UPI0022F33FFC|nr:MerR family transcriptional regulator [Oceanirhabdus sp. W0125-5]WBW97199.1 MerR family transcriptional regulator [Oceanirhabdus sp. W0125-5]
MYRIGQFSKINRVTIKTLHHYDEVGLLPPAYVDEENGYRYYTSDQMLTLHKIISLRNMGFSINEVISVINNISILEIYEQRKAELEAQLVESQKQLSLINYYISELNGGTNMNNYQIIIKELPQCIVYSKRIKVSGYHEYFELIPQIGKEILSINPNLKCTSPEYCFIIYHDGEYKDNNMDIEFCEAVKNYGKNTETISFKTIESTTAACVLHKGPYDTIGNAYAYIFKWIDDNDYTISGNPRESHIDGIWNKDSSSDWLTEVQVPIKQKNNI